MYFLSVKTFFKILCCLSNLDKTYKLSKFYFQLYKLAFYHNNQVVAFYSIFMSTIVFQVFCFFSKQILFYLPTTTNRTFILTFVFISKYFLSKTNSFILKCLHLIPSHASYTALIN